MNLQELATTLALQVPDVKMIIGEAKKTVERKLTQAQIQQKNIQADDFSPQPDFFCNEDGTPCEVISVIKHGVSGVALVNSDDALPWIRAPLKVSQDELAILASPQHVTVIGFKSLPLHRMINQLGNKAVTVKALNDAMLQLPVQQLLQ